MVTFFKHLQFFISWFNTAPTTPPPMPHKAPSQPAILPPPTPEALNGTPSANGENAEQPNLPADFWDVDEYAILHPPAAFCYEMSMDIFFNARHYIAMENRTGPIHAHSYRLQVRCRSRSLSQEDQVVIQYQTLQTSVKKLAQAYNNTLLNELPPFEKLQPTTEVLAGVLFQQLYRMLETALIELISITVWESPTVSVTYRVDPQNAALNYQQQGNL